MQEKISWNVNVIKARVIRSLQFLFACEKDDLLM